MYLVVIGWLYVVLMMAVAEASNTTGSLLGAIVTFFLYGLVPVALVVYLMRTPHRRRLIRAREAADAQVQPGNDLSAAEAPSMAVEPDAGGHAARAAEDRGVAAVREEP